MSWFSEDLDFSLLQPDPAFTLQPYLRGLVEEFDALGLDLHAVLFRQWQLRVKGRDWFDLEWTVWRGVGLHLDHLAERARQGGHWPADQPVEC